MKEKTVKNKATLALLRSNIRRRSQEWALAKKVNSGPLLLPDGWGRGARAVIASPLKTSGQPASAFPMLTPPPTSGGPTRGPFWGHPLRHPLSGHGNPPLWTPSHPSGDDRMAPAALCPLWPQELGSCCAEGARGEGLEGPAAG